MAAPTISEHDSSPISHDSSTFPSDARALPEHASPASTGLPDDASQHPAQGAPPKGKRSWLRILLILLLLLAVAAFIVYRVRTNKAATAQQANGAKAAANRPVPVAFDVVQQRAVPIYLTALGTVTAYNTVTLKSRVDGQITRVNFREGQRVGQGQLLLEIDPRPYQAALAQAQGNLVRDQANAANADAQQQRYNQLYAAGVVSREQAQAQESTAGQAGGTIAADRAAIEAARVNLAYTRISSPISGIVGLRQVDIGNIVAANSSTGLVVITQVEPIAVIFTLPEDQLPQVFERMRSGARLVAEAWDRANTHKLATGQLLTVDNQIDTTTGTAKLKAVFSNTDGALFPNQFVNIHLVLENRPNAIILPAAAVQTGAQGSYVFWIDMAHPIAPDASASTAKTGGQASTAGTDSNPGTATGASSGTAAADGAGTHGGGTGKHAGSGGGARQTSYLVHTRNIAIDLTQGNVVVVHSGVQPGDRVVTDGEEKLKDGSKVIPRPAATVDPATLGNAVVAPPASPKDESNTRSTRTANSSFNNGNDGDRDGPGASPGAHKGRHKPATGAPPQ